MGATGVVTGCCATAAIVGRLGTASLGAVGLSTLLFVFSNLFFNFLTVVTTSNVAGAYAIGDEQEVRRDATFHLLGLAKTRLQNHAMST